MSTSPPLQNMDARDSATNIGECVLLRCCDIYTLWKKPLFDLQGMLIWNLLLTDQSGLLAAGWLHVTPQCTRERVHDWQLVVGNGTKMSTECSWIS
uniref:Uncharacterized protein n=1 Tax=Triticum urartu TaxID=4572 RepID=A0A8R7UHF1_TRIUA